MNDPFKGMKEKITYVTAFVIFLYFFLLSYLIDPKFFNNPFFRNSQLWIKILFGFISLPIAYFFVILDIHNWLDKTFFKERIKVDNYIREQLTTPCRETSCTRAKKGVLKEEQKSLMGLFYTFIPPDGTERIRAYNYWEDYFIMVNLSILSIFSFIIASVYIICIVAIGVFSHVWLLPKITNPRCIIFIVILILPLLFKVVRQNTAKKLLEPTEAQTKKILVDCKNDLKNKLPDYRSKCQKHCPFFDKKNKNA